jgi:hypothetical protein
VENDESWTPVTRLINLPQRYSDNPFRADWTSLNRYAGREQFSEISTYNSLIPHDRISWASFNAREIESLRPIQPVEQYTIESYEIKPGEFFTEIISSGLLGNEKVASFIATLADGSPVPAWLKFDPIKGVVYGDVPRNFTGPMEVKLTIKLASGKIKELTIKIGLDKKIIMSGKPSFQQSLLAIASKKA